MRETKDPMSGRPLDLNLYCIPPQAPMTKKTRMGTRRLRSFMNLSVTGLVFLYDSISRMN